MITNYFKRKPSNENTSSQEKEKKLKLTDSTHTIPSNKSKPGNSDSSSAAGDNGGKSSSICGNKENNRNNVNTLTASTLAENKVGGDPIMSPVSKVSKKKKDEKGKAYISIVCIIYSSDILLLKYFPPLPPSLL